MAKKMMKLADIGTNFYVRKHLIHDRVEYFMSLIEAGEEIPPLKVAMFKGTYERVDGRHRSEAYVAKGITEVEVEIITVEDAADLIAKACEANSGGSAPPTTEDYLHVIMELLKMGTAQKHIPGIICLPPGMARSLIKRGQSMLHRQTVSEAMHLISEDNYRVSDAAGEMKLDEDELRKAMGASRKRNKAQVTDLNKGISTDYDLFRRRTKGVIQKMFNAYDDADVNSKDVFKLLEHVERLQKNFGRTLADYRARFEAKAKTAVIEKAKKKAKS